MCWAISCSVQTTSFSSDFISDDANDRGSGVIRFTQCEDSHGVSTGTGIAIRRCRPAIAAYLRIISV